MIQLYNFWRNRYSKPKEVREREYPLEQAVCQHIRKMPFLFLPINDEPGPDSMRGFIKRKTIVLLSNHEKDSLIDLPSKKWMGRWARSVGIQRSGLWNVNHIASFLFKFLISTFS